MAKIEKMQEVAIKDLIPYERNAKRHDLDKIKESIKMLGFISPILIDKEMNVIAGHGRLQACTELGIENVPCVFVEGLTEDERKAYIILDNKLVEEGGWNLELLESELADINIDLSSFDIGDFEEINIDDYFIDSEAKEKKKKCVVCPNCGEEIEI